MHRTKVKVAEEALDANTTIAHANRADFDRESVAVVNLMSRSRGGQDHAARGRARRHGRRARGRAGGRRAGQPGRRPAERAARAGGAAEHRRRLRRRVPPGRQHGAHRAARPAAGPDRPAGDRERGQPGLPGRVPRGRGRQGHGVLGHRGRGQAAEVPADVPHLRAGGGEQDRPAAPPGLRPGQAAGQHPLGEPGRGGHRDQRQDRRGGGPLARTGCCTRSTTRLGREHAHA